MCSTGWRGSTSSASGARTSSATRWSSGSSPPTTSTASGRRPSCAARERAVSKVDVICADGAPDFPTPPEIEELAALALASADIQAGHLAVELVDEDRIRELNRDHPVIDAPTDVLSFPIDEDGAA